MTDQTVVKIVSQMKTGDALNTTAIREFWRKTKPAAAPDNATVNIIDLCDEVDKLRGQVSTLKDLCRSFVISSDDKKLRDQILEALK